MRATCSGVKRESFCSVGASWFAAAGLNASLPFAHLAPMRASLGFGVASLLWVLPPCDQATQVQTCARSYTLVGPVAHTHQVAIMRSTFGVCLALCVLGLCSGSSLRVDRVGFARGARSSNEVFMMVSGKSGPQEMCLVIADGARFNACVCRPVCHAAWLDGFVF